MAFRVAARVRDRAVEGVADRLFANRASASRAPVPMTVLMVTYTVVSLQTSAELLLRYSKR